MIWNQTLVCVTDVPASSAWYCAVLGGVSGHGGDEYEQIVVDGELILQLHRADVADHHGYLADPSTAMGNGVALWFEVSDFEAAVARIRTCGATVQTEPHMNPPPASMRSGCATPTAIWSCWPGRPSGAFDIPANAGISKIAQSKPRTRPRSRLTAD